MPKQKYNPVLGQHIADFTEWYRTTQEGQPVESSLQKYGGEHSLSRSDLYEIARYLEDHGWTVDASILSPDYEDSALAEITGLEGASVFDRYFRAIKDKRYEDAHDIYESMTSSEQQVIKDRRATTVFNKLYKIAQKARREGWQDIVTKIATLWDEQPQLLAESYRSVLEEMTDLNVRLERARKEKAVESTEQLEIYLKELEQTKKQMEDLMKEKGVEHPLVGDATRLLDPQTGIEKFKAALMINDWEVARDLFMELTPEQQAEATEMARGIFSIAKEVINLHKLGSEWFAQGKYVEAAEINDIVQACLPEMEIPEGQQLVLLIVDPQLVQNLPQAFEAQKQQQGPAIGDVLEGLRGRALPGGTEQGCPEGQGVGPVPQMFNRVVELANALDDKGLYAEAGNLDQLLIRVAEEVKKEKRRPVNKTKCEACGMEMYYTEGTPRPRWCRQCLKDPWSASKVRGSLETTKKEKRDRPEKPSIAKCEACGVDIWYKPGQPRPRWCPSCLKGPWSAPTVRGSTSRSAKDSQSVNLEKLLAQARQELTAQYGEGEWNEWGINHPDFLDWLDDHGIYVEGAKKKKKSKPKMKEGKPAKVIEIADAIRRDDSSISDEKAYRMAWETYCSYVNPGYASCTPKGKSKRKRKSPKPYSKASMAVTSPSVSLFIGKKYQGDLSLDRAIVLENQGVIELEQTPKGWIARKKAIVSEEKK